MHRGFYGLAALLLVSRAGVVSGSRLDEEDEVEDAISVATSAVGFSRAKIVTTVGNGLGPHPPALDVSPVDDAALMLSAASKAVGGANLVGLANLVGPEPVGEANLETTHAARMAALAVKAEEIKADLTKVHLHAKKGNKTSDSSPVDLAALEGRASKLRADLAKADLDWHAKTDANIETLHAAKMAALAITAAEIREDLAKSDSDLHTEKAAARAAELKADILKADLDLHAKKEAAREANIETPCKDKLDVLAVRSAASALKIYLAKAELDDKKKAAREEHIEMPQTSHMEMKFGQAAASKTRADFAKDELEVKKKAAEEADRAASEMAGKADFHRERLAFQTSEAARLASEAKQHSDAAKAAKQVWDDAAYKRLKAEKEAKDAGMEEERVVKENSANAVKAANDLVAQRRKVSELAAKVTGIKLELGALTVKDSEVKARVSNDKKEQKDEADAKAAATVAGEKADELVSQAESHAKAAEVASLEAKIRVTHGEVAGSDNLWMAKRDAAKFTNEATAARTLAAAEKVTAAAKKATAAKQNLLLTHAKADEAKGGAELRSLAVARPATQARAEQDAKELKWAENKAETMVVVAKEAAALAKASKRLLNERLKNASLIPGQWRWNHGTGEWQAGKNSFNQ